MNFPRLRGVREALEAQAPDKYLPQSEMSKRKANCLTLLLKICKKNSKIVTYIQDAMLLSQ